jgi:hypothetical protein
MFKQLTVLIGVLLVLTGSLLAQAPPENSAVIRYHGIEFTYEPDAFGALLPTYSEGTPFQTDAPYFANTAPHVSMTFTRPNPSRPDSNFIGELRVYGIADLEVYGEPSYRAVIEQLRTLDTCDLSGYANAGADYRMPTLPFMPVLNATQVLRAHPRALNFDNVNGIEYYTYYSQGPEPILEGQVLYVYQGITTDGKDYVSFSMPVVTGLLASELPEVNDWDAFVAHYAEYLQETFAAITNADPTTFAPAPAILSRFIESIAIHKYQ